jgi:hypothetical protein
MVETKGSNAMSASISYPFDQLVADYHNTAEHNDNLYRQMTDLVWSDPLLGAHRRYVEDNKLGFGDAAFHAMWLRLLNAAGQRFGTLRAMEIGVFKGQVISLWALIAKCWAIHVQISGITPLVGHPMPQSRILRRLRRIVDHAFREEWQNGNFYPNDDYDSAIHHLFDHFDLSYTSVAMHRGFSTDQSIVEKLANETFHILYVDGDHTYEGSLHDFTIYGPKVVSGGWLVADDAGCALPGNAFWKGHPAVTRAVEILPKLGFRNVLNVGHNRVYERE